MKYELKPVDEDKRLGGFNDLPPNFQEISERDFWLKFSTYTPSATLFRQAVIEEGKPIESLHMFLYGPDEGIGYTRAYNHDHKSGPLGFCAPKFYFKFGICDHNYVVDERETRMCYHAYVCTKCGKKYAYDSSG